MMGKVSVVVARIVAVLCVLAMLPVINAAAANTITLTKASDGTATALATTAAGITGFSPKTNVFAIEGTSSNSVEITILSSVDGDLSTDKIAYINQMTTNSSDGTFKFSFTLRDGIPDGTYCISVGGEGVASPTKRYFKIGKSITLNPISPVPVGNAIAFTGTVSDLTSVTVQLLNASNAVVKTGSATISGTAFSGSVATASLTPGTYTVRVFNGTTEASRSVVLNAAPAIDYGDVCSTLETNPMPNGVVNLFDAQCIVRYTAGAVTLSGQALINADADGNGIEGNMFDARAILLYTTGTGQLGPQ